MLAKLFKHRTTSRQAVNAPLLSVSELHDLQYRAENLHLPARYKREVAHRQYGDARSVYRGYGLDYEESRPYQPGDEMRFMNWRLSARSDELYVKVFREERRPSVFILVDRRARMRFGSGKRLKVSQAARVAALLSYQARLQNAPVGGVLLEQHSHWVPEQAGETGVYDFINALVTPCPPVDNETTDSLEHTIRLLTGMLAQGTIVYLVSDFYDLNDAARPALLELATEHQVHAIAIVDRNERELPRIGGVSLGGIGAQVHLDSSDHRTQQLYRQLSDQHYADIRAVLSVPGMSCTFLDSDDDDIEQQVPTP